ncbi:peptidoglycan recognition protein [Streptomyces polyrhachis]|uniref:Peptidoglycan recognition protein n=1 Tax=Streptomyces polyrhachis TaxID=1282885 RepID=A0ABW2GJU1_9ACTN
MRPLTVSSIGALAAAALASLALVPTAATADTSPRTALAASAAAAETPGATQSLPLLPLPGTRADQSPAAASSVGLPPREVHPFSMIGIVWRDPSVELHGTVQVRTRARGGDRWSDWQTLATHGDHAPDLGSQEAAGPARGGTAPLWVGDCDGVQVRVTAAPTSNKARPSLPSGLRVELVDPGADDESPDPAADEDRTTVATAADEAGAQAAAVNAGLTTSDGLEVKALSKRASELEATQFNPALAPAKRPFVGPRPGIVTRRGWGADERLREKKLHYTRTVRAAFVHHSATGNGYRCAQSASVLRGIYRYHVQSLGWADLGYNFAIDKCGRIFEGRAGGVAKPVLGAHTFGFNQNSMGIVVLGTFDTSAPSAAAVRSVSRLTAWKLGLYGGNPGSSVTMVSAGGKYAPGKRVRLRVISGHRDGFTTACPGARLYGKLPTARTGSAQLQGR